MKRASIREWPADDRPREKLLSKGAEGLSEAELLAILLRSGSVQASALDQARLLLNRFGSIRGLAMAGAGELCQIKGFGPAKASQVMAAIEIARRFGEEEFQVGESYCSSADVYNHFRERLASAKQECFYAVLLDTKNRKMKEIAISRGSLAASFVHPRDVFAPIVRESAAGVIFVHNHPSGDPTPSRQDVRLTQRLREVGDLLQVRVFDHIIIGRGKFFSFVEDGYW